MTAITQALPTDLSFDIEAAEGRVTTYLAGAAQQMTLAFLELARIHHSGAWREKKVYSIYVSPTEQYRTADERVARELAEATNARIIEMETGFSRFGDYLRDLLHNVKQEHPAVSLSVTLVYERLRHHKRFCGWLGMDEVQILSAPLTVLTTVEKIGKWDYKTGHLKALADSTVLDRLPEGDTIAERVRLLADEALAIPVPGEAIEYVDQILTGREGKIIYAYWGRIVAGRLQLWCRREAYNQEGIVAAAEVYELWHDELPDDLLQDLCSRLSFRLGDSE